VLLLEKLLALENEMLLRKQEKPPPEEESVQLHQEKVLEEPQEGLQEGEDARIFSSFFKLCLIRTVNKKKTTRSL